MILLSILFLGCGGSEASDAGAIVDAGDAADSSTHPVCDGGLDAGGLARGLSRVCSGGIVASGFALRNPRAEPVSRLGAFIRPEAPEGCEAGATLARATLVTELDPRLDEGTALVTYHVLGESTPPPPSDGGVAWEGIHVARGSVGIDIDSASGSEVTLPVLFDLELAGLDTAPIVVVVLDGFEIDTDVPQATGYPADHLPADGYRVLSVGAAVDSVTRAGVDLRFEATATLGFAHPGTTPMDRAAAIARARMIVHYSVVGLSDAPPSASVSYRSDCRPESSIAGITVDGPVGGRAIPALSAFSFVIQPGSEDGTLVRELSVLVDGFAHDPSSGQATMDVSGFVEGPGDAPLETLFEADLLLLGWSGAEPVESLRYASPVGSGHAETGLPLTP